MIEAYRKLWNDRASVRDIGSYAELCEHIRVELDDSLTHPRLRRTRAEKLVLALERISRSELTEEERSGLSELYEKLASEK